MEKTNMVQMPSDIPLSRIKPAISLREEFDDWALLFNPDTGHVAGLTPIAVTIWKSLVQGSALDEIVQQITAEYEVAPGTVEEDIRDFCADLVRQGYAEA